MRARRLLGTVAISAGILVTSFAFSQRAEAAPKTKVVKPAKLKLPVAPSKESAASALIRTDGALVYSVPDFDGEILATLREGQQVRVSRGTAGSVAKFHKVRVGPVLGYIAEIDIQVVGATKKREHKRGAGSKKQASKNRRDLEREKMAEQNRKKEKLPFLFTRYVGLTAGLAGYSDKVGANESNESLLVYGLRMTGPDLLIQGPILDFNLVLHYGAPKAYSDLSIIKPSGYFIFSDVLLLLPVFQKDTFAGTLGIGPNISYRSFRIVTNSGFENFSGLDAGLSLAAGLAYRAGAYAVRLDGKYLVDNRVDTIFQLSLQNEF